MKKEILITILCTSLMLVTPFTTIAQENKISSNLIEQPYIEGLVAQIRTVVNEILQKYGHIPKISNLFNLILNLLELIGKIMYCIVIAIIVIPIVTLYSILEYSTGVFYGIYMLLGLIGFVLLTIFSKNCIPSTPFDNLFLPFKSIYKLSERNDITKSINDCPCLQD